MQYLLGLIIPVLISIAITKSFKIPTRIMISVLLTGIIAISSACISIFAYNLIDKYAHIESGLGVLLAIFVKIPIVLLIFVPLISFILNRYNLEKISRKKFIIYMMIIITTYILGNLIII